MIVPDGHPAAFGAAAEGDGRSDDTARTAISRALDISPEWAIVRQVHGTEVLVADRPGRLGEADGIITTHPGLPLAVATADCLPVVLSGAGGVGIAHAGWRGAAAGVVAAVRTALADAGAPPSRAAIGPGIGPCCFEVGPEVAARFEGHTGTTTWGTTSVDLPGAVSRQLEGLEVWRSDACTHHDESFHSFRRDGTTLRQVTVTWLPPA
jgi:hypothetical protein